MPVRFQVDSDFYDHPKTLDMSDAATALWVRAGSYSAAKLTDGFVADAILARLSHSPVEASTELVRRGLWRRVRGGYQFHQWEERGNLTRERIEHERSADRQRKRRARQNPSSGENGQVSGADVRSESGPESSGTPGGFRGLSVSVSESVSSPPNPQGGKRGKSRAYDYDEDSDFARFWDAFPKKAGKPAAYKAWRSAITRGVQPQIIIDAALRYRDSPRRNPEMTKYPQGWLNDERYNDFDEITSTPATGGWWDN